MFVDYNYDTAADIGHETQALRLHMYVVGHETLMASILYDSYYQIDY